MSDAQPGPREALDDWLRAPRRSDRTYEATLEDHFGETQPGDLLARCALAALSASGAGEVSSLRADWIAPAPPSTLTLCVSPLAAAAGLWEVRASAGESELCRATIQVEAALGAGPSYQDARLPAALPDPDSLPRTVEYARKEGWPEAYAAGPVEFRRVGALRPSLAAGESAEHVSWLSLRAGPPSDPQRGQAALVFLACFYAHWEFERRLGERFVYEQFVPRAHEVRIHRAARPEGWLLLHAVSRIAAGGRALGERRLFARDGTLLASVTSEALLGKG